jgi:hypothetical protein
MEEMLEADGSPLYSTSTRDGTTLQPSSSPRIACTTNYNDAFVIAHIDKNM